jgi:hypothetical protein
VSASPEKINTYLAKEDIWDAFVAIALKDSDFAEKLLLLYKLNFKIRQKEKLDAYRFESGLKGSKYCFFNTLNQLKCDSCYRGADSSKLYSSFVSHLIPANKFYFEKLFRGDISLRLKNTDEVLPKDSAIHWDQKYQNIVQSLNDIALFQRLSEPDSSCNEFILEVSKMLFENGRLINQISANEKELYKVIYTKYQYTYDYSSLGITPDVEGSVTYHTLGKFSIRPDFGVGYYGNLRRAQSPSSFQGFLPFFGLRFNLYPLDPNVAVNKIKYQDWFLYRSSINVSWSFIGISDGATRANAFQNLNFVLGYGYRINNYLNFSTGAMFFKAKSTDPFNDNYFITALPYVAFTFDFDVVQQFQKFVNLFMPAK